MKTYSFAEPFTVASGPDSASGYPAKIFNKLVPGVCAFLATSGALTTPNSRQEKAADASIFLQENRTDFRDTTALKDNGGFISREVKSGTANERFPTSAVTSPVKHLSDLPQQYLVKKFLEDMGFPPDRHAQTVDGSTVFEYFHRGLASIDIYPNGEIILIISRGEIDDVHEFGLTDLPRITARLRDAGFAS